MLLILIIPYRTPAMNVMNYELITLLHKCRHKLLLTKKQFFVSCIVMSCVYVMYLRTTSFNLSYIQLFPLIDIDSVLE